MAGGHPGLFWAFVWAEESAGGVHSPPAEWGKPCGEGGDGHVVCADAMKVRHLTKSCNGI